MEMLRCGISDQLILLLLVLAINPSEAAPLTLVNGEGIVRINKVNRITDSYTIITANVRTREQGGELEGASDSWKRRGRVTYYRNRGGQWGPAISDVHKVFGYF